MEHTFGKISLLRFGSEELIKLVTRWAIIKNNFRCQNFVISKLWIVLIIVELQHLINLIMSYMLSEWTECSHILLGLISSSATLVSYFSETLLFLKCKIWTQAVVTELIALAILLGILLTSPTLTTIHPIFLFNIYSVVAITTCMLAVRDSINVGGTANLASGNSSIRWQMRRVVWLTD